GKRLLSLGEQIVAARVFFPGERNVDLAGSNCKVFDNLMLGAGEIGEPVEHDELQMLERPVLPALEEFAGRPEPAFLVVKLMPGERVLIGYVARGQFGVLGGFTAHPAGGRELLWPDFEAFQLTDEVAYQVDEAIGVGDWGEVLQAVAAGRFVNDRTYQLTFHL